MDVRPRPVPATLGLGNSSTLMGIIADRWREAGPKNPLAEGWNTSADCDTYSMGRVELLSTAGELAGYYQGFRNLRYAPTS